jgi:predicted ATPase/class 3 adenylate cyclase
VLFADVANYTAMAEKLDPEIVHQVMDGCFNLLMTEIHKYEGTINQFTGDGVMALFGAPVAHEDHAQRACHAALSVQKSIADYGEKLSKDLALEFKMRIGINSGFVVVGAIGDDLRMDYTAIGDTTNLASRVESIASPGSIFVSENTFKLAGDYFEFRSGDKVNLKGKEENQQIYELLKPGAVDSRIGASAAKGLTKFVGRRNSMTVLTEALNKARSGSGQVVGVVGEAGVGKSRLILELRRSLQKDKIHFLEGKCLHYGGGIAYLPVLDILKSHFDIKEGDTEIPIKKKMEDRILHLDEKLGYCLYSFQELLSLKVDDESFNQVEPQQKKEKIFEAFRDLFIRESQNQPLVLVVEDLHWIDRTSEELIDYFIGWLAKSAVLLVLLYRPEYTHRWGSKSYYYKIGLDHLTHKSGTKLIKAILNDCEIEPELENLILNRAAGNPLFIEELTHNLLENGSIQKEANQCVLSKSAESIQVPDSLQGIIAARIDRIEETLKRVMQVASVIGREFAYRILQTISGTKEDLKSHLFNLQGLEFIYEKSLFPELEYIFKHALTQEVAYNSLLSQRRREIHANIARAIEEIYGDRLEELYEVIAYHHSKAENYNKAYDYFNLSGKKSVKMNSHWEAYHAYTEAFKALEQLPQTNDIKKAKIEIATNLNTPASVVGYPEGTLSIFLKAEQLAKELEDKKSLAHIYNAIKFCYALKGNPKEAQNYGENLYDEAEKLNDIDLMAPTAWDLCLTYLMSGKFSKIVDMGPNVIFLLEDEKKESSEFDRGIVPYSNICVAYGLGLGMLGNFNEGEKFCEKGLQIAKKTNNLFTLISVEMCYGIFYGVQGKAEPSIIHLEACIEYAREMKNTFFEGSALTYMGLSQYFLGKLKTARDVLEKATQLQIHLNMTAMLSYSYTILGMVHFDLQDHERALKDAEEGYNLALKTENVSQEALAYLNFGRLLGKVTPVQFDKAQKFIQKGIQISKAEKIKPRCAVGDLYLGELNIDMGEKQKGLNYLKSAEEMFIEMDMDFYLATVQRVLKGLLSN